MIQAIVNGAIGGLIYGLAGYFRNKREYPREKFDWAEILPTVIGSAIIGALAVYLGVTADTVSSTAFGVVVTQFLRKVWQAVTA